MALPADQQLELQAQLQQATTACSERCLYFAAKWIAELLNAFPESSLNPEDDDGIEDDADFEVEVENIQLSTSRNAIEAKLEKRERTRFVLAKSYFDCREYDRCAAVFLPLPVPHGAINVESVTPRLNKRTSGYPPPVTKTGKSRNSVPQNVPEHLSQKALFLALYARYLAGEKRKNEESEPLLGPTNSAAIPSHELSDVLSILDAYFNARGGLENTSNSDGWLDFLFGMFLSKSKSESLAKQWLLRSLNLNPWNWSAWLELAGLAGSSDEFAQLGQHLPQNIMTFFFHIHCSQELFQQSDLAASTLTQMLEIFPNSAFLQQQKATMHYHAREHDLAVNAFDTLIHKHPYRLDGLEVYSNLLYVLPNRPKLATLASRASSTDKFRPETNCVLGNYYSLISEHEKAVLHFRRALALDRTFQVAWTLMGHEYIELKNTQAAIESYRRAVDINRKDYRAWYGLGQGYEMLECYSYSLFYYQRAAALCPGDPKMWSAVGNAYSKCNKTLNAIQAYKRALVVGSQMDPGSSFTSGENDPLSRAVGGALDPQTLYDIALLYERESNLEEAAAYMELTLAQEEGADEGEEGLGVTQITSRARLWLARWSYSCGDWQRTMLLANELCQDGIEVEEAKSLVKDVRARLSLLDDSELGGVSQHMDDSLMSR